MTPDEWRRRAAEYDAKATAAAEAGDRQGALTWARAAQNAAIIAEDLEQTGSRSVILDGMLPAARVRIAKGATRGQKKVDPLHAVASAAGHTMRSLAEKLGCSNVYLSKARQGERSIRESWAKAVQELTRSKDHPNGFAATRANWPGGWAREPKE